jgi:hypothetical protein
MASVPSSIPDPKTAAAMYILTEFEDWVNPVQNDRNAAASPMDRCFGFRSFVFVSELRSRFGGVDIRASSFRQHAGCSSLELDSS